MGRLRRKRNKNTALVRADLDARSDSLATALVLASDFTMEYLVSAVTESLERAPAKDRKRDETALTAATEDPSRVVATWVWLAHSMVQRTGTTAEEQGETDGARWCARALELLAREYPLDSHGEGWLAAAKKDEPLGPTEDDVIASGAFELLLGEEGASGLAFYEDPEEYTGAMLLNIALNGVTEEYVEVLSTTMSEI